MVKLLLVSGLLTLGCKKEPATSAEPSKEDQEKQDLEASFVGFAAAAKDIHEHLPAVASLTADQPCPAGVAEAWDELDQRKERRSLTVIEQSMLASFTGAGAPAEAAFLSTISDDGFGRVRGAWGLADKTYSLELMQGLAGIYHSVNGTERLKPYVVVFLPVEMVEPSVIDASTFRAGKIDGWLVVFDTKQHTSVCHARVIATNDDVLTYDRSAEGSVAGDLERRYAEAAVRAIDGIAKGALVYHQGVERGQVVRATDLP
jgi:hypothetical protein